MDCATITYENFSTEVEKFIEISNRICDGWKLQEINTSPQCMLLRKETFIETTGENINNYLKAEYVISYSTSYNVPMFAFNLWTPSGILLTLKEIREKASVKICEKDFYSVITQQEHPILFRPMFVVHPCHTGQLLATFKNKSSNLLVTFISLISPLTGFNLSLDYAKNCQTFVIPKESNS